MVARSRELMHAPRQRVLQPRYGGLANNSRLSGTLGDRGLETLLDSVSDAIVFLGARQAVRYMNEAARAAFGTDGSHLLKSAAFQAEISSLNVGDIRAPRALALGPCEITILQWTAGDGWIIVGRTRPWSG